MVTESDYSVTITGHVVCLVALSGFDLMPSEGHSVLEDILAGEELTRVQLEPSLITGERYLLVNINQWYFCKRYCSGALISNLERGQSLGSSFLCVHAQFWPARQYGHLNLVIPSCTYCKNRTGMGTWLDPTRE